MTVVGRHRVGLAVGDASRCGRTTRQLLEIYTFLMRLRAKSAAPGCGAKDYLLRWASITTLTH